MKKYWIKNIKEIYLDLSKLSEEQRKDVVRIIISKGQKIYKEDELLLKKGLYDNYCYFLSIDEDDKEWVSFTEYGFNIYLKNKTEVTYEEFKTLINE